jgi:hypothetical protein
VLCTETHARANTINTMAMFKSFIQLHDYGHDYNGVWRESLSLKSAFTFWAKVQWLPGSIEFSITQSNQS